MQVDLCPAGCDRSGDLEIRTRDSLIVYQPSFHRIHTMSDEEVAVDSNDVFGDSDNDEVDSEEEEEIEEEERGKSGKRKKTSKSKKYEIVALHV